MKFLYCVGVAITIVSCKIRTEDVRLQSTSNDHNIDQIIQSIHEESTALDSEIAAAQSKSVKVTSRMIAAFESKSPEAQAQLIADAHAHPLNGEVMGRDTGLALNDGALSDKVLAIQRRVNSDIENIEKHFQATEATYITITVLKEDLETLREDLNIVKNAVPPTDSIAVDLANPEAIALHELIISLLNSIKKAKTQIDEKVNHFATQNNFDQEIASAVSGYKLEDNKELVDGLAARVNSVIDHMGNCLPHDDDRNYFELVAKLNVKKITFSLPAIRTPFEEGTHDYPAPAFTEYDVIVVQDQNYANMLGNLQGLVTADYFSLRLARNNGKLYYQDWALASNGTVEFSGQKITLRIWVHQPSRTFWQFISGAAVPPPQFCIDRS